MRKILLTSQPFQQKTSRQAESMVGAYRTESTDQWTAAHEITLKIPPRFDGSLSWFKYEELFYGWLDSTEFRTGKQLAALKIRLVGDAEMYKETSQSRISESRRWSQVFQGSVEFPLHQWSSEYFPLQILSIDSSKESKH